MINKTYITAIIFILFLAFTASSFAAETIAVVLKAKGDVNIVRGNQSSQLKVKRGFRLQHGDKLVTGKKGYAALRFIDDASLLRVRANSTCIIRGERQKDKVLKNVYLEVGTIFARVTKQKGKFEISTPTSVASVKGTEWYTEQRFEGRTFYYCTSGAI